MKPILPQPYSEHRIIYPCYVQPILTGTRALYQMGHFQSSDETPLFFPHLTDPLTKVFPRAIILDGMISPDCLFYHVFDRVDYTKSFAERYEQVANILGQTAHLHNARPVETHRVRNQAQADVYHERWHGLIYRLGANKYTNDKDNHTWSLLLRKPTTPKENAVSTTTATEPTLDR